MATQDAASNVSAPKMPAAQTDSTGKTPIGIMVASAIIDALFLAVFLVTFLKTLPGFLHIAYDFDLKLSALARSIVNLSYFLHSYWYICIPILLAFCVGDLVVTYFLFRQPGRAALKIFWKLFTLVVPICLLATIFLAIISIVSPLIL